jgi:uncharacterized protein
MPPSLRLKCNPTTRYSILRWSSSADISTTLKRMINEKGTSFLSITTTSSEISVVIDDELLESMGPLSGPSFDRELGWISFSIDTSEPIPFDLVGILLSIAQPLAKSNVGIFALSTYNTDHVLIKEANLELGKAALESAGHTFIISSEK